MTTIVLPRNFWIKGRDSDRTSTRNCPGVTESTTASSCCVAEHLIDSDEEDDANLRKRKAGEKTDELEMEGLIEVLEENRFEADGLSKLSSVGIFPAGDGDRREAAI